MKVIFIEKNVFVIVLLKIHRYIGFCKSRLKDMQFFETYPPMNYDE